MSFLTLSIGSYDHTVRLFDSRIDNCVLTVDHGAPVESVLMFPTGGMFVSAGKISYHYVKAKWFYLLLYLIALKHLLLSSHYIFGVFYVTKSVH